ncbi:hypothetical protein ACFXJ8_25990 [Nonomuraea sp. NPDC059194]|uniref:hypothetical protein n=1 Tax=Nonomuraea sp. NPDC059194 TaxID=3346764 RepID=UPI0036CE2909
MLLRRFAVVAAAALALSACGQQYDEAAHRAALEASAGHPVKDWAAYRQTAQEVCEQSEEAFGYSGALAKDGGTFEQFQINVRHLCADRQDEVEELIAITSKDYCAPPQTESDKRMFEAMGCPTPTS